VTHLTLPSEVEPESLADLVADCRSMDAPAAPEHRSPHDPAVTEPQPAAHSAVTIPDSTAALLDGMPEYGD
jgi:hypothetical protein